MFVNLSFDSSVNNAPAGFVSTVNAVAQFFQTAFSDNVTINGLGTLTIDNASTAATATTIRFIADAKTSTVQNCTIKGSGTGTAVGTIFFSTGTSTGSVEDTIVGTKIRLLSETTGRPAIGLRLALRRGRGSVAAPVLLGAFGMALLVAGVFATDPALGYPPGAPIVRTRAIRAPRGCASW